jgi:hypothetical protein
MSDCPGLHCPGCGDVSLSTILKAAGALAAVAVAVWLVMTLLWLIAAVVGLALVAVVVLLVWMARRGSDVATVARGMLPPPEAMPITGRPARALPAPELHIHLHGPLSAEDLAGVAALRQAGHRAWPSSDG